MKKLYLTLLLSVFVSLFAKETQAQKYIIFISGYGSDIWSSTNIVNDWSGLVPAGNIMILDDALRDFPQELQNFSGTFNANSFEDFVIDILEAAVKDSVEQFLGVDTPKEIVLVGHSYGGYVARLLEHAINSDNFLTSFANVEVTGVLTIATPHQGVGVAGVSYGPNNDGLRDVSSYVNDFRDALVEPYTYDQSGIIGSWISTSTLILTGVDAMTEINDLFSLMDDQIAYLQEKQFIGYNTIVGRLNFNGIIGYDGVFPELLNSINTQAEFRSIYGVEKTPIPVRISDEFIGNGNESAAAENFSAFRRYYKAEEDLWNARYEFHASNASSFWCILQCRRNENDAKDIAKRKRDNWRNGRYAIENVDDTWGEIIDSYFTETQYIQVQEYVGVCDDGGPGPSLSIYANFPTPSECTESGFRTVTQEVTVVVAQKNDAVFAPQYGVWKDISMPYYATGRASGNYFYSDTEDQGGYNHMELRRYKSAYNDSDNGIVQGQTAKPMREARDWLLNEIFN